MHHKSIYYCLLLYGLVLSVQKLCAQDNPLFAFSEIYDSTGESQTRSSLKKFEWQSNPKMQRELFTEFSKNYDNGEDIYLVASLLKQDVPTSLRERLVTHFKAKYDTMTVEILEDYLKQTPEQWRANALYKTASDYIGARPSFWDFDKDKKVDVIAIPAIYFGPTEGFRFYAYTDGKWQLLINNSGIIFHTQQKKPHFFIHFVTGSIDPSECEIFYTIQINTKERKATSYKAYAANNAKFPKKLDAPMAYTLPDSTVLRTSPTIDDKPTDPEMSLYTKTLRGNVLATFPKGAKLSILAKEGDWLFVASLPTSLPTQTSLYHGMDTSYNENFEAIGPKEKPYYIGWIKK